MKTRWLVWQIIWGLNLIAAAIILALSIHTAIDLGVNLLHSKWTFLFFGLGSVLIAALAAWWLPFSSYADRLKPHFDQFMASGRVVQIPAGILLVIVLYIYPVLIFSPTWGIYFTTPLIRFSVFWLLTTSALLFIKLLWKELSWPWALLFAAMSLAGVHSLALNFTGVSAYPFSLGWSEASRYYSASLFFAERFYGMPLPGAIWNPSLNLLLAVPWIFGDLPIWGLRAWWAIVQTGATLALGAAFVARLAPPSRRHFIALGLGCILFLAQQSIYVQLLLCALIVVWGVKPEKFWCTMLIVVIASVWAGLSRVNWFPVPGLLAGVFYLLEIPFTTTKRPFDYLLKPALWFGVGTCVALLSNLFYMRWSGNGSGGNFASSIGADLLWYRLFPSATNPVGVLPAALFVSMPVLLIIGLTLFKLKIHPIRWGGLLAALLVLFAGGLVVSVKIGGGADLHNLDAYLILLMLLSGYFISGRTAIESANHTPDLFQHPWVYLPMLLVPLWLVLQMGAPMRAWETTQAEQALTVIQSQAERATALGQPVLFITQRHLLPFKQVQVPLVPDYELEYLTEMILSRNQAYLDRFHADLRAQRFGMVVVFLLDIRYKGRAFQFGEEDDAWVREIAIPMLCYYERIYRSPNKEFDVLVPRSEPCQ